jgi:hypothetical protein
LFASAAICLAVIGIDVYRGRSIKVLGAGCVVLFTGSAPMSRWSIRTWPFGRQADDRCRRARDLAGVADHRKPFILQYALEEVDAETAKLPGFKKGGLYHHLGLECRLRPDDHQATC